MKSRKDIVSILEKISDKIDDTDYSGYTIQYPPMFIWKKTGGKDVLAGWGGSLGEYSEKVGLYLHIPFCVKRCNYCRYYSVELRQYSIKSYVEDLKKEIEMYSEVFKKLKFKTLYVGGGTPSLLSLVDMKNLFSHVFNKFDLSECEQFVFEGTSDFLSLDKLKYLQSLGLNRLTLGVQTLDNYILRKVNRFQDNNEFYRCFKDARKVGIRNINVDLMAGLEGQNFDSFEKTLSRVIKINPDMIHVHPFLPAVFSEYTREGNIIDNKKRLEILKMIRYSQLVLKKNGYKETRFDSDAKRKDATNLQLSYAIEYNSSYLGLGAGAVSHATGYLRYANIPDVATYSDFINKKKLPVKLGYKLTWKDEAVYFISSVLRYKGISKRDFRKLFGRNVEEFFPGDIRDLEKLGKIRVDETNIHSLMDGYKDHSIYSKYFYSDKIIKECLKKM